MLNKECYANDDLLNFALPNDGVAEVSKGSDAVLKYELSTFVCEGQYEQGLVRILDSYLANLAHDTQPAAWISGFYGSGKSHLVKMLAYLWTNTPLQDGTLPRDVKPLPAEVQNLLIVTGDPIPTAERDEVKSVYQFNSRKMTHFIRGLEKKGAIHPFHVFGALNINAINFDAELGRAEKKIEKGMQGLLTQPVLSRRGLENLRRAKTSLNCYILGGIIPVISERNARFMNSEVNGIDVEEALIQRYVGLNREEAENLALEVSVEIGKAIARSADGFYVITPFNLVSRIVEAIRDGHVIS